MVALSLDCSPLALPDCTGAHSVSGGLGVACWEVLLLGKMAELGGQGVKDHVASI